MSLLSGTIGTVGENRLAAPAVLTDRYNYRCVYCRTGNEGAQYSELPMADYLRMVRIFVELGIEKVRLTGGEPLLRKGLVDFVRDLAKLRTRTGEPLDLALTTNG